MAELLDDLPPREALVKVARDFHARGWMVGTAGNLSAREDREHIWITASGKPKGRLDTRDFLLVRVDDGEVVDPLRSDNTPSAETAIHRALYRRFPETRACLHVHSVGACLADAKLPADTAELPLPALEMIKGFDIWEERPAVALPLFENALEVRRIAEAIEARFATAPPRVSALMVRGHGVTVWGASLEQAYNRLECLEFLLACAANTPGP